MFVAAEFQSMRRLCPSELEKLLDELSISVDRSDDEYRTYERIDALITKKICDLLKSESIFDGYTNLLKLGDIPYDYSELDSELLDKIVSNGDKILAAVREANYKYDSWQTEWSNVSSAPERSEVLSVKAFDLPLSDISFNLKTAKAFLKRDKSDISNVLAYISDCINKLETKSEIPFEDISELLRKVSMPLHDDKERTLCLKIKKRVQFTEKKIPPSPPKPAFTDREAEDALKILLKVNDITKKIAR